MFILVIVNKNYFLWLMCLWVIVVVFDIFFKEVCVLLDQFEIVGEIVCYIGLGCVLVLFDGDIVIWDLLFICEYLVE